jgi:hypothetical protein
LAAPILVGNLVALLAFSMVVQVALVVLAVVRAGALLLLGPIALAGVRIKVAREVAAAGELIFPSLLTPLAVLLAVLKLALTAAVVLVEMLALRALPVLLLWEAVVLAAAAAVLAIVLLVLLGALADFLAVAVVAVERLLTVLILARVVLAVMAMSVCIAGKEAHP